MIARETWPVLNANPCINIDATWRKKEEKEGGAGKDKTVNRDASDTWLILTTEKEGENEEEEEDKY